MNKTTKKIQKCTGISQGDGLSTAVQDQNGQNNRAIAKGRPGP